MTFPIRHLRTLLGAALLTAILAPLLAPSSHAQFTNAGDRERQSVAEQLEAFSVGDTVEVMLENNRRVRPSGVIVEQNEEVLRLRKDNGSVQTIRRDLIFAITRLDVGAQRRLRAARDAITNAPDPSRTRMFVGQTGRTMSNGEVQVVGQEVLAPSVAVGFGRPLDLRVGISAVPILVQFAYGGAKFGLIQSDGFNVAVGALGVVTTNVISTDDGGDEYGGVVYGVATLGSPRGALTLGGGYAATGGAVEEQTFGMLGGEVRFPNSRFKLLTENYVLVGSGGEGVLEGTPLFGGEPFSGEVSGIGSVGIRYVGRRVSLDAGVATSNRWWDAELPVLPILNFTYVISGPGS